MTAHLYSADHDSKLNKEFVAAFKKANDGLRPNGASIDWQYRGGGYQEVLRAYGRSGRECQRPGCAGRIRRIVVGQRSTHFCPVCQPKRGPGKDWVAAAARRARREDNRD